MFQLTAVLAPASSHAARRLAHSRADRSGVHRAARLVAIEARRQRRPGHAR